MAIAWEAMEREATEYLQQLLRIDTSNPPGNEMPAIRWLHEILAREGCTSTILESAPGRANLVCRHSTGGRDGPLLMSSHVDVVPARAEEWTHSPFGGDIADGCLWGRGAIDMKSMTIYTLMALLLAKRQGLRLRRDLILAAVADEERGCTHGSAFLVDRHPELIRAEYGLNELGGFTLHVGAQRLYPIEVAQKGFVWLRLRATGRPGHGSMPHADVATAKIARAVQRLALRSLPYHLTPTARDFLRELAAATPGRRGWLLHGLRHPPIGRWLAARLPPDPTTALLRAILHNTACPTGLAAGSADSINVIAGSAECLIDGRILPGQTTESFLAELRDLLGPGYEYEVLRSSAPHEQPRDTALFRTIAAVVAERDPGARAVPFLVPGFDDSHHYHRLGITMYGFQPIRCPADFNIMALYHAPDERIPVAGFHWGLRTFWEVVQRFCG